MGKQLDVVLRLTDEEYDKLNKARQYLRQELGFSRMSFNECVDYLIVDWLATHQIERVDGGK